MRTQFPTSIGDWRTYKVEIPQEKESQMQKKHGMVQCLVAYHEISGTWRQGISLVIHNLTSDRRPAVAVLMRPHWSKNHLDGNPIGEVSNDQTRDRKHDVVHASHIFQEQIHQHLHQTQQESHECSNPLDESQLIHSHWSKHLHHHPRIVHKGVYGHLLQIQNGTDVAPEFHHSIAETCLRNLSDLDVGVCVVQKGHADNFF